MQGASYQLFPSPGGSGYKHSAEVGCDSPKFRKHVQHKWAAPDNPGKLTSIQQFVLQFLSSNPHLSVGEQLCDPAAEFAHVERFVKVITRPLLDRLNR